MNTKAIRAVLVLTFLCQACAPYWECDEAKGDFCVHGVLTELPHDYPRTPELQARLEHQMEVSAAAWNKDVSFYKGWRIKYVSALDMVPCDSPDKISGGCTVNSWMGFGGDSTMYLKIYDSVCLEYAALPHEMGHVALGGDHNHDDPRWATLGDQVGAEIMQAPPLGHCHDLAPWYVKWLDHQLHHE